MADSSEIQSKADAEIQRSQRDQQESSFLEAVVPIPDFFFNIKAEIEPIGGSKWVIRMLAYFLYFLTLCVMFGSFAYYSLPAQRLSLESIVTSEWQKSGYVCKPLQKTALHGLSTDWSFDECIANVNSPDTSNVSDGPRLLRTPDRQQPNPKMGFRKFRPTRGRRPEDADQG